MKYNSPITKEELKKYQGLPLKDKIKLSNEIIIEFVENIGDHSKIYLSSSFGKDSIVMIDLVRKIYPDIVIGYVNTGVEHPSCIELSKEYENVITLYPKKSMKQIVEEYGYPLPIGKEKTNTIELCRKNLYEGNFNTVRVKKMRGDFGEGSLFNFSKYQYVIFAPFKISNKCCDYLKKEPFERFSKEYGYNYSFVGTTAQESLMRKNNILNHGFNTSKQSRPLGHWNVQDVLQYCLDNNLKLPSCYGEIIEKDDKLMTSEFIRTGCTCCPIGSHLNKENDFQKLYKTDRKTWDYVINELGFYQVLDFFNIPYKDTIETEHPDIQTRLI